MLQPRKLICIFVISSLSLLSVSWAQRCPQGWVANKNSCYFFSVTTANWNTAKSICATRGAVLAPVNSKDEASFFTKQIRTIGGPGFYVGANDRAVEKKWANPDGSAFPKDKSIWGRGQPDDNGKNGEDCGTYLKFNNYILNDAPCNSKYRYICERSINYKDPCDSENGWHLIGDKCYRYFQEPANWLEARQSCQDSDADLITISSNSELSLVTESVSCNTKASIWLGYSDVNDAKTLQWVDGSTPAVAVTRWDKRAGEPKQNKFAKGSNCAASITLNKNLWQITNCVGNDMAYVCEKDKGQCPPGWHIQNGMCYKTNYVRKSWPEAVKTCQSYGGALATRDQASKAKVQQYNAGYWVGISDRGKDGQFADMGGNLIPTSQLSNQKPNQLMECGIWKGKKLQVASCYSSNYYTCFASLGAVQATPTAEPPDGLMCHDGWVKNKDTCYKRVPTQTTYAAAKADCITQGSSLIKIDTQQKQDFLVSVPLLMNTVSWIGLDDLKTTGKYLWIDGTTPTFTNWSPKEPNNLNNKEHCAEMQAVTWGYPASWNDIDCTASRSYICEMKAVPGDQLTTPRPTRPWSTKCGQGWIYDDLADKCYYFSLDQKSWQDAGKTCQKLKSTLMCIDSKYEQSFLQGMLRGDTSGALAYWVGANDLDAEQGWKWTDKSPFRYFNWNSDAGEPNSNGNEDCVEVVQLTGKWNDNNCNFKRNYICERSLNTATKNSFATTPLPTITDGCKKVELISGEHWVPDSALSASTVRDKDSGAENSRIDWTAADAKVTINTPNKYDYKPVVNLNLQGVTSVTFKVTACNDAHISLQPAVSNITRDAYEVVIGGWRNTQSVIRSEHQGATTNPVRKDGILDCKTAKPFWISWATGKIQVGTGYQVTGQTMFMEKAVTESLTISGMAVTTGWGATGVWVVTNPHGTRKGAWSPKYTVKQAPIGTEQIIYGQWIQVDFAKPTLIRSVTTKGSATTKEWVAEYSLEYSYETPYNFQPYVLPGTTGVKYFAGNKDQNTAVTNNIEMPFEAQFVRLRPRKFINYPSLRWAINGCPPPKYCDPERLVTGISMVADWCIKASSLKGSSVYDSRIQALPGKPKPKGWIANAPDATANILSEEWIQIYLKRDMLVHGVVTKGHADQPYWVKSYQVQTKSPTGGFIFVNYQEPYGTIKTFTANTDQNTAVTNMFGNPVIASYIRIIPKEYNTMIGMRVDVLGCLEGCALSPMLNGPNPISLERLSASSSMSAQMGPSRALLDTSGFGGAWVPKVRTGNFFLQVDFGITERIRAITTQGRSDVDQWVKQFALTYSQNAKNFYNYQGTYRFPGNTDRNTKVKNFFSKQITARAIRVHPKSWVGAPAMRVELYGCSGSKPKYVGCFNEGSHADSFEGPSSYFSYNGPAKCAASCFKGGYMYAGLNRGTCKCGSMLPNGGQSDRCDYKCRANNKQMCGGYSSGLVSVYETGIGPDDERCPVGYETYNSKCFKVNKVKKNWQDSRQVCIADGGDLATINSYAEQSFVRFKLKDLDYGAWIGLNDLQEQMSFEWADGSPVRVTYWQHSEPNNWFGKREDCVEAISYKEMGKGYLSQNLKTASGWWNDRPCEEMRYSICQKKKVRMPGPASTPGPVPGCPFGWKAYQSSCYLFHEHSSTWSLASSTCKKEGGTLVRVNDEFEQEFITKELYSRTGYKYSKASTRYWTDLSENFLTREYVWSNNWDVIPYTQWAKGEPKPGISSSSWLWFGGLMNCVAVNGQNEVGTGRWVTRSCSSGAFPLCERPRKGYKQPPLPTLAPEDIPCPGDWVGVGPNCYQINNIASTIDMKMWEDAEEHCVRQGAHLAYINNGTENELLWRNFVLQPDTTARYWIGLNDRATNKGYNWVSGDAFSYSNWKTGEPNDWDGLEPCVMMDGSDGLWNDEKCHIPMNWICSISRSSVKQLKTLVTTPEPTAGKSGSCPDGDDWKFFQGHCYYVNKDLLTFRDAQTYCNSKGAHLISVQSSIENSFARSISKGLITNFIDRSQSRANIGSVHTQVWTGLNELDRSKGHRWIDGSSYSFSNWAQNEPNDYNGGEYCVAMYVQNGEWNDGHCSIRIPSVCEKNPSQTGPITTALPPHIDGYCPDGYIGFENDCYKIVVDTRLNWTSADTQCVSEGGHLATVSNSRQQTFLTSQLNAAKRAGVALWLGLQHGSVKKMAFFSHATSYTWADNKDVTFTNWNHGEPNGLNEEGCAEMLFNPAGRWNDVSCASERGYVCKKQKDGTASTGPKVDNSRCSTGYTYWEDSCYKYVNSKGAWSYLDGTTCSADGASLVSIQDPYEYSYIRTWLWSQSITEDIWIGLMSQANTNSFTWSNGWPLVVTYWGPDEPAHFVTAQGCVVMDSGMGEDDGTWVHRDCTEMHSAICKKPLNDPPYKTPSSGLCRSSAGETWVANTDGFCYMFNVDPRFTFDEAEAACRAAGADLASLHSPSDTSFVTTQMEHLDVKGGNGGTKNVWIGLRKQESGAFKWTDTSAVGYANWANKEPNSVESNEKCTEVWSPNSNWNDVDCQSKRGFICKIKQGVLPSTFPDAVNDVPTTSAPTTPRNSPCPLDGWSFYKGSCYLLVSQANEMLRWNEASDYCQAPGREANLVSIHSEEENQWIVTNLIPGGVVGDAWTGLAELQTDNRFRWIDGTTIPYVNWDGASPPTNTGSMECVSMRMDGDLGVAGRWAPRYCFTRKAFICKMDAKAKVSAVFGTPVTDGALCHFPFRYRGQDFSTCTTYGSTFLWCATSDHYERDGQFAICDPFRCPSGWRRHERMCYHFSSALDTKTWVDAEQSCADMGSDLGYIGSAAVESFIADNINEYFWIGLNDRQIEGGYIWDHRPNMIMRQGFTNWGIGEPRSVFGTEDCTQIVNGPYSDGRPGEWVMGNCAQPRRYICMKEAVYTLDPTTAAPTSANPVTRPNVPSVTGPQMVTGSTEPSSGNNPVTTTSGGKGNVGASAQYQSNVSPASANTGLSTGGIVAIVVACIAAVIAAVFIFLFIRKSQSGSEGDLALKSMGFENASYSRSKDSVQVGLENPGASF